MKINIKQYAEILFNLVDSKSASDVKSVVKNFIQILASNHDLWKIEKIIGEFIKLWNKKNKIVEAEIISARDLSKDLVKLLNSYLAKLSGAKEVVVRERINRNILGGVIMRYGDKILDGSVKTKLDNLKIKMVK